MVTAITGHSIFVLFLNKGYFCFVIPACSGSFPEERFPASLPTGQAGGNDKLCLFNYVIASISSPDTAGDPSTTNSDQAKENPPLHPSQEGMQKDCGSRMLSDNDRKC